MGNRTSLIERMTRETSITAQLALDGAGKVEVGTGVGFLDHMITSAMVHGFFDLTLRAEGDTHVDDHHTVEDAGIVLGQAFASALGDYGGIRRFGHAVIPMEEALAGVAVDLSRRPCLVYEAALTAEKVGTFDSQLVEEFWRAFTVHASANMHIDLIRGRNMHHGFEAVFKAAGRALDQAVAIETRTGGITSTKGAL